MAPTPQLSLEQLAARDLMQKGFNVFLTGSAGTGKSTVTAAFIGSALARIDVTATTGIAAINLRDSYSMKAGRLLNVMTIYRWLGIGLGPKPGQTAESFFDWWSAQPFATQKTIHRIRKAECLIIDEISMLPGRLLDYMNLHCRRLRQRDKPFGGIQVIAVGDFLQLPPVDKEGNGYDWAFQSSAWLHANFRPAVLTQVHRQADPVFAGVLNDFRIGKIGMASSLALSKRVVNFPGSDIPRLFTHNHAVEKWNHAQLQGLSGETREFTAIIQGQESQRQWLIKNLVTPWKLELRVGARVMVTANLSDDGGELILVNGTMATVRAMESAGVEIETDDGRQYRIPRYCWSFDPQDENSATFIQIPLRLAWASTIHKAQGLSLYRAFIDIRAAREPGQAYVAVSRIRTLDGLFLRESVKGIFVSEAAIAFHAQMARKSLLLPANRPVEPLHPELFLNQ